MAGELFKGAGPVRRDHQHCDPAGTPGASAAIGRTEGFANILEEHDNWNMLDMRNGDSPRPKGKKRWRTCWQPMRDIDVVVCQNDNMAFGAVDAIHAAGKTCGPKGDIVIISFDAVKAAFDYMIEGTIHVDFECNPFTGPGWLRLSRNWRRERPWIKSSM